MNPPSFIKRILNRQWSASPVWLPCTLLLFALALRLFNLEGASLWMDEIYSLMVANTHLTPVIPDSAVHSPAFFYERYLAWQPISLEKLLGVLKINVHLPLYYLLLNPWLGGFGDGAAALRSLSAVFSTLMLLPLWFLAVALGGRRLGMIALLVAACSPFQIYYGQEGRMYAFALLWTTLSSLAFWKILYGERPARWSLPYALSTVAGAASHYMFVFILAFHGLYALLWLFRDRDWRRLALFSPALIGLFSFALAWLPVYRAQRQGVGDEYHFAKNWVGVMRYITTPLWQPLVMSAGDNPLQRVFYFPLTVMATAGILFAAWKRKTPLRSFSFRREGFLLLWIFVPLFLQIAYDAIMRTHISVIDRYVLLISPAISLWVAWGLAVISGGERVTAGEKTGEKTGASASSPHIEREQGRTFFADTLSAGKLIPPVCAAMVVLAVCAVWPHSPFRDEHNKDHSIRDKIAFMTHRARPGDLVFVSGPWGAPLIAAYYLKRQRPEQPMVYWINQYRGRPWPMPDAARLQAYRRVWLFRYRANNERGLQQTKDYLLRLYPHMRKDHDWSIYSKSPLNTL